LAKSRYIFAKFKLLESGKDLRIDFFLFQLILVKFTQTIVYNVYFYFLKR